MSNVCTSCLGRVCGGVLWRGMETIHVVRILDEGMNMLFFWGSLASGFSSSILHGVAWTRSALACASWLSSLGMANSDRSSADASRTVAVEICSRERTAPRRESVIRT